MRLEKSMIGAVDALILDLLEWLAKGERSYAEVMEAWRTSCPRLPVWEDAMDRGLIAREHVSGRAVVRITSSGRALLDQHKPSRKSEASQAAQLQ
jgi:hypothetical protein